MKRVLLVVVALGCLIVLVSACGASAPTASDAFTYTAAQGGDIGVFMVVKNPGSKDDSLVSASTTVSSRAELHTVVMAMGGGMQMKQVPSIVVPAGGQVELKSGSFHVMVFGLNKALNVGDTFPVTLRTQSGRDIKVQVTVKPAN
jgi:periplasmic copper chaperone A